MALFQSEAQPRKGTSVYVSECIFCQYDLGSSFEICQARRRMVEASTNYE